ncbi:MAG: nitrilase family protein [Prevotella sp.]|nr:nitrilase family protein [Prevotella sp.]
MKATLVQMDIRMANAATNRETAERTILAAPKSDLYVLPEMWTTGFVTRPQEIAETDGLSLEWMTRMAQRLNAAICGSIATEENGRYYNRLYFVTPDGTAPYCYDKRHLFTYSGEHLSYTAGDKRVIVLWRGVRFLLQVCYDLRFPCFARNDNDYDAIIYVASWPESRIRVWHTLLCARAIENQCYVLGVNRIGRDDLCTYNGGTEAYDAYGRCIGLCCDGHSETVTVNIDTEALYAFRQKFPVLNDRDNFILR